jgi:hypothetical protein
MNQISRIAQKDCNYCSCIIIGFTKDFLNFSALLKTKLFITVHSSFINFIINLNYFIEIIIIKWVVFTMIIMNSSNFNFVAKIIID